MSSMQHVALFSANTESIISNKPGPDVVTLWKGAWSKHTPFALESQRMSFDNESISASAVRRCTINRSADMLYDLFLRLDCKCKTLGEGEAAPAGAAGNWQFNLIDQITLHIGHAPVARVYGSYLAAWEALSATTDGKQHFNAWSSAAETVDYVHIPMFFSRREGGSGSALALVSLQYHSVTVDVRFSADVATYIASGTCALQAEMAYLDISERSYLASQPRECLITEVQYPVTKTSTGGEVRVDLPFNHSVDELIIITQPSGESISQAIEGDALDFDTVKLMLNHQNRFYDDSVDAEYLHQVARRFHSGSRAKKNNVAVIPFSMAPEAGAEPAGSLNFSRIDRAELVLGGTTAGTKVIVLCRSKNLLRYSLGLGGLAFAS